MANELNIQLDPFTETGLTLLGKVFSPLGAQQDVTVSMSENAPGLYSGDLDLSSINDGAYVVRFETNTPDKFYGDGVLYVRDNAEVSQVNSFNPSLDEVTTDTASRDASKADITSLETKAEADARQTNLIAEHNDTQTAISNLNDFDPSTDTVTTDTASREASKADVSNLETKVEADARQSDLIDEHVKTQTDISNLNDTSASDVYDEFTTGNNEDAFKADVSGLATKANQITMNEGIKKASLPRPYKNNLPNT